MYYLYLMVDRRTVERQRILFRLEEVIVASYAHAHVYKKFRVTFTLRMHQTPSTVGRTDASIAFLFRVCRSANMTVSFFSVH